MDHADHVALIRAGVPAVPDARWADIGAGTGAFTLALADLLGPGATVLALDREGGALRENERLVHATFPSVHIAVAVADFTAPAAVARVLAPTSLDGMLMANSLHFVRDKAPVLRTILPALRPGGRFVLVEYGADRGNPWVPWPLSFGPWERLADELGLVGTRLIGQLPSRFLGSIYAAASDVPLTTR